MPAHLFYGDSFLVTQALKGLQEQVGPPEVLEANNHRLSGGQLSLAQLRAPCDAMPFLAERRLVIVEGLLALFEPPGRRRRPSRQAGARSPSPRSGRASLGDWESLPRYIGEEMAPTTTLVFLEERLSKANPLMQALRPAVQIQEFLTLSREGLARWIRNRIAECGGQITPGAIRLLSELVGGNLWTMGNELEKLELYASGRPVEEGDVRLLVSQAREASIFSAVDALLDGKPAVVLPLMHRLRDDGAEFPYIVAMIARQLRLVTVARDLIDRGHGEKEIGDRLGISRDFVLRRTVDQARKHSWRSLEWLYGRLMELDLAVKRGRLDQDVALELLGSEASAPLGDTRQRPRQDSLPSIIRR